jgi:hypothetical protein
MAGETKQLNCPCCKCCCTVHRQIRGFDFSDCTWACAPTGITLTKTIDEVSSDWETGTTFQLCEGSTLEVSGFPATIACTGDDYVFREATLFVYCNGVAIFTAVITSPGTLSFGGMAEACFCDPYGGRPCEILVDAVYTRGSPTAGPIINLTAIPTFLNGEICSPRGCIALAGVCVVRASIPDRQTGRTTKNLPFQFGIGWNSGFQWAACAYGKQVTVTWPGNLCCPVSPFNYCDSFVDARWDTFDSGEYDCVAGGPSATFTLVEGESYRSFARYGEACSGYPACE